MPLTSSRRHSLYLKQNSYLRSSSARLYNLVPAYLPTLSGPSFPHSLFCSHFKKNNDHKTVQALKYYKKQCNWSLCIHQQEPAKMTTSQFSPRPLSPLASGKYTDVIEEHLCLQLTLFPTLLPSVTTILKLEGSLLDFYCSRTFSKKQHTELLYMLVKFTEMAPKWMCHPMATLSHHVLYGWSHLTFWVLVSVRPSEEAFPDLNLEEVLPFHTLTSTRLPLSALSLNITLLLPLRDLTLRDLGFIYLSVW